MKYIICILLTWSIFNSTVLVAHPGGHFQKGEVLNSWRLKSGEIVTGNFSFAKDDKIFLEQISGNIKPIFLQDLILQDQKLAKLKIAKYLRLNQANTSIDNVKYHPEQLYILLFLSFVVLIILLFSNDSNSKFFGFRSSIEINVIKGLVLFLLMLACGKSGTTIINDTNNNPSSNNIPKTSTLFIDSAFTAFKSAVGTSWDDNYFYVASNGMPNHNMMIGIKSWQQQVPISQPYNGTNSWSIPLQPVYASSPLSTKTNLMKGAVAIAVNGVPIFNALNNRGEDAYKIGELDNWGGHCGRADDYHYHAAPLHLSSINGLKPIAFAVDGFPVYGSKEPDGSAMNLLDTCNGHIGQNGIYHYHGTLEYPYVIGALKGKVTIDPSTTAPENQVIPQAFAKPVRPATTPLNGAIITDFTSVGNNGYLLTYIRGNKSGYVRYSWDVNNKYTFILTDTAGNSVTNTYQR